MRHFRGVTTYSDPSTRFQGSRSPVSRIYAPDRTGHLSLIAGFKVYSFIKFLLFGYR